MIYFFRLAAFFGFSFERIFPFILSKKPSLCNSLFLAQRCVQMTFIELIQGENRSRCREQTEYCRSDSLHGSTEQNCSNCHHGARGRSPTCRRKRGKIPLKEQGERNDRRSGCCPRPRSPPSRSTRPTRSSGRPR